MKKDENYLGCSKHIWYTYYNHKMQGISLQWLDNYLGCSKHILYTYYIHIMQGISLQWLEMV